MKAFITGSRAYGLPRDDSDIDLVIRCDDATASALVAVLADESDESDGYDNDKRIQVRAGQCNLMLCRDDDAYEVWRRGTEALRDEAMLAESGCVSRERAVEVFKALREETK